MKTIFNHAGSMVLFLMLAFGLTACGGPSEKGQTNRYQKTKDRIEAFATKNPHLRGDIKAKVREFETAFAAAKALGKEKTPAGIRAVVSRMTAYEKAIGAKKTVTPKRAKLGKTLKGKLGTKIAPKLGKKIAPKLGTTAVRKVGGMMAKCIDVETASAKQLEGLKGIGPALAKRIIGYRAGRRAVATRAGKAKWNFRNWATLLSVPGLSSKICSDNRSNVCFLGRVQKTCPAARTGTAIIPKTIPAAAKKLRLSPKINLGVKRPSKTKLGIKARPMKLKLRPKTKRGLGGK